MAPQRACVWAGTNRLLYTAQAKKVLPALAGHITEASAQLTMPLVCCVLLWCVAQRPRCANTKCNSMNTGFLRAQKFVGTCKLHASPHLTRERGAGNWEDQFRELQETFKSREKRGTGTDVVETGQSKAKLTLRRIRMHSVAACIAMQRRMGGGHQAHPDIQRISVSVHFLTRWRSR